MIVEHKRKHFLAKRFETVVLETKILMNTKISHQTHFSIVIFSILSYCLSRHSFTSELKAVPDC